MKLDRVTITWQGLMINGRDTGPCIYGHIKGSGENVVLLAHIKRANGVSINQFNKMVDCIQLPSLPQNLLEL